MTEITITMLNGETIVAPITAQAEHTQELMKSDEVKLSWSSDTCVQIPMGAYITYNGRTYYAYEPHTPTTTDNYEWKYTPVFKSEVYRLSKTPFMLYTLENSVVTAVETDWNFTGDKVALSEALEDAIFRGTGLSYTIEISEEIDKALIMSFSNVDIITALNNICNEWECEWWYDSLIGGPARTIYIGKSCIHGEAVTITDGVEVQGTTTKTQNTYYNRFYVFGSDRNIPQDYSGAQATQVVNKRLTLNPTKYPQGYIDLPMFDADGNVLVDTDGMPITDNSMGDMIFSKVIMLEDIYPKSDLSVQSICTVTKYMRDDNDNVVYLDDDKTIPDTYSYYYITLEDSTGATFTINPSTYDPEKNANGSLIKGKALSLHMSSGALTGREFELIYHEQSKEVKGDDGVSVTIPSNCFEVVFIQDNTIVVPNTNIAPKVGDKAIVFNIRMPQSYINSAYEELEEKALIAIYEQTRDKNAYTVKSNQVWFAENNPQLNIGRNITYVSGGRNIVTRVTKIVTKLDRPSEISLTFCKELSKGSITTIVEAIESTERHVTEVSVKDDKAVQEARRKAYQAQRELKDMVFDTDGYFKDGNLRPQTIETLLLSVGATSTQFTLQNVLFEANYNRNSNAFNVASSSGKLIHYGIDPERVKTWNVNASTRTNLVSDTAYYVYAQCSTVGDACNIVLSSEQYKYNALAESNDVYMFLVGTLSSVMSGVNKSYRILSLTYGATTINGGQLRTGRISSVNGGTYFDLDTGEISGQITFTGPGGDTQELAAAMLGIEETATLAKESASSAVEKVDNLQVGGRNLLLNSQVTSIVEPNIGVPFSKYADEAILSATQLTLSFDLPEAKRAWIYVTSRNRPDGEEYYFTFYPDTTWVKGRNIITIDPTSFIKYINNTIGGVEYLQYERIGLGRSTIAYNIKLESGNKVTDWTPAPEDTEAEIQAVKELTITGVDVEYAQNQSTTTAPTSGWQTDAPTWQSGYYIWQRTATTYGGGVVEYSTPTCISGRNGVDGANGTNGKDGVDGKDGANGADGAKGDTGVGVESIVEQYYLSTSATTQTGDTWRDEQPEWASDKYIWTRSVVTYDNGDVIPTDPVLAKAINGANSTANTANNTANTANTTANTAQATANTAKTTANTAQATANTAKTTANTAQATANTAKTTANTAKTTADSANSKVDNMQIGGRNLLLNSQVTSIVEPNIGVGFSTFAQTAIIQSTQLTLSFDLLEANSTWIYVTSRNRPDGTSKYFTFFSGKTWSKGRNTITIDPTKFINYITNTIGGAEYLQYERIGLGNDIKAYNVKLELGNKATDWTPAPEDVDKAIAEAKAKAEAMEYLTNAMQEGSTDIAGGVVLTNAMQLKNDDGDVVSGVCGSKDVRFWSGGTLADALLGLANFIVNSDGVLKAIGAILNNAQITSGDGTNDIDISGGSISLKKNGSLLTQILAQTLGATIDAGLSKFVSNLGTPTTSAFSVNLSGASGPFAYDYTGVTSGSGTNSIQIGLSGSGEKTIFTASANGILTFKANISVSTMIQIPTYTCTRSDTAHTPITPSSVSWGNSPTTNINVAILDNYNNVVFSGSPTSVSGKSFNVVNGRTYRLRVNCLYSNYLSAYCGKPSGLDPDNEGEWFLLTLSWNKDTTQQITIPAVSFNGVATAYNNKIFNDGLIMSADADSYVAIAPKSTADIFRMRHGSAIYKLLANTGLHVSYNGGTSFAPVNPIALVVRLTYSGGVYNANPLYNPYGKTVRATRSTTGTVKLEHNLGTTNYTICGVGVVSEERVYISMYDIQQSYCYITIGDDYTPNDYNADITFIRY